MLEPLYFPIALPPVTDLLIVNHIAKRYKKIMTPISLPFLYHDENWLVVNKPTGMSTHAANEGDLGVAEWLELHHGIKIHVCSRLDKGTSGVLLLALNTEASARAQKIHQENLSKKIYYFISDKKRTKESKWICNNKLDLAPCETVFELTQSGSGFYLYRAEITRGKKHQIRRHQIVGTFLK